VDSSDSSRASLPIEDVHLLQAAGRGDRQAYATLVDRHHRTVIAFVHRFLATSDPHIADDLAQEAFLGAWKSAATFRPRGTVLAWLLRITMNACLNYRRSGRIRKTLSLDAGAGAEAADSDARSPESGMIGEERARQVRAAVGRLPANQRAAILLRHYHGLAYADIAEVLESSVSAVESLLFRARATLRETLREE
jgi:RNA polymerase sigma-70 factor (ECF subfamily)